MDPYGPKWILRVVSFWEEKPWICMDIPIISHLQSMSPFVYVLLCLKFMLFMAYHMHTNACCLAGLHVNLRFPY